MFLTFDSKAYEAIQSISIQAISIQKSPPQPALPYVNSLYTLAQNINRSINHSRGRFAGLLQHMAAFINEARNTSLIPLGLKLPENIEHFKTAVEESWKKIVDNYGPQLTEEDLIGLKDTITTLGWDGYLEAAQQTLEQYYTEPYKGHTQLYLAVTTNSVIHRRDEHDRAYLNGFGTLPSIHDYLAEKNIIIRLKSRPRPSEWLAESAELHGTQIQALFTLSLPNEKVSDIEQAIATKNWKRCLPYIISAQLHPWLTIRPRYNIVIKTPCLPGEQLPTWQKNYHGFTIATPPSWNHNNSLEIKRAEAEAQPFSLDDEEYCIDEGYRRIEKEIIPRFIKIITRELNDSMIGPFDQNFVVEAFSVFLNDTSFDTTQRYGTVVSQGDSYLPFAVHFNYGKNLLFIKPCGEGGRIILFEKNEDGTIAHWSVNHPCYDDSLVDELCPIPARIFCFSETTLPLYIKKSSQSELIKQMNQVRALLMQALDLGLNPDESLIKKITDIIPLIEESTVNLARPDGTIGLTNSLAIKAPLPDTITAQAELISEANQDSSSLMAKSLRAEHVAKTELTSSISGEAVEDPGNKSQSPFFSAPNQSVRSQENQTVHDSEKRLMP